MNTARPKFRRLTDGTQLRATQREPAQNHDMSGTEHALMPDPLPDRLDHLLRGNVIQVSGRRRDAAVAELLGDDADVHAFGPERLSMHSTICAFYRLRVDSDLSTSTSL